VLFSVDAISPDGRSLYVIEYPGEDLLDYHVRVLDTRTGRRDPRAVVDPRKPDEQMGGMPKWRGSSVATAAGRTRPRDAAADGQPDAHAARRASRADRGS
jgi:hypothetical protein